VEKTIAIRWRDIDGFRHVNNSVYLTYLEEARDALVEAFAGPLIDRFVIRRIEIDYLSQLVQDDGSVRVTCDVDGIGTTSVRTREEVHALSDGRLVARAAAVLVYMDDGRGTPEPIGGALRERVEALA
jgi:acyl-CoA thioester hydrolase